MLSSFVYCLQTKGPFFSAVSTVAKLFGQNSSELFGGLLEWTKDSAMGPGQDGDLGKIGGR